MAQNDKERDNWIEAINKAKLATALCVIMSSVSGPSSYIVDQYLISSLTVSVFW